VGFIVVVEPFWQQCQDSFGVGQDDAQPVPKSNSLVPKSLDRLGDLGCRRSTRNMFIHFQNGVMLA